MRMRRRDGWLVIDGERAYKSTGAVDIESAARLVQHGALVAALNWDEDVGGEAEVQWVHFPVPRGPRTARTEFQSWLQQLIDEAPDKMEHRWLTFKAGNGRRAVVLVAFED